MASNSILEPIDVDDPIEYYLEDQHFHGKSQRTLAAYERVLRRFEQRVSERDEGLESVSRRACMEWIHEMRGELQPSTIATYASYVNRFYGYLMDVGAFDRNPMTLVIDQMDESIDTNPIRRDISLPAMRSFLDEVSHPLHRAIIVTFLKTGMRVGELCNLDMRDISMEYTGLDIDNPQPRGSLSGRSDAIFVDNAPARGAIINGERRTASNKRKRATIIPIDAELRRVLHGWFAIRPTPISSANPVFIDTRDAWGERLTPESVRHMLRRYTTAVGWYANGNGADENVTPHYFRHFFTTHLRDRTGDRGIVKYLRGDVADDIIDTYTHDWGDRVRRRYEANIYHLLD